MVYTSDAYENLVKSNIRPKCEPVIKIEGKTPNGENVSLIWEAKNIKNLTYKRKIDPVGRELPYMELVWTEIYKGKFDEKNYPEKYNNVVQCMAVKLSFVQNLSFYNTWKTIYGSNTSWKSLFNNKWKDVKNSPSKQIINMPTVFLIGKPTIKGQTITWTARDVLYFLTENHTRYYNGAKHQIPWVNPMRMALVESRSALSKYPQLFASIMRTDEKLEEFQTYNFGNLDKDVIVNGSANDCLRKYANTSNYFWNFTDNYAKLQKFGSFLHTGQTFGKNVIYPDFNISNVPDMSSYSFKRYVPVENREKDYFKEPSESKYNPSGFYYYKYDFDGYGKIYGEDGNLKASELMGVTSYDNNGITITPISHNGYDEFINVGNSGDAFVEDNSVWCYDKNHEKSITRSSILNHYFNNKCKILEFTCLPNFIVEVGDMALVETNSYFEDEAVVEQFVAFVQIEITFDGTVKEKVVGHALEGVL